MLCIHIDSIFPNAFYFIRCFVLPFLFHLFKIHKNLATTQQHLQHHLQQLVRLHDVEKDSRRRKRSNEVEGGRLFKSISIEHLSRKLNVSRRSEAENQFIKHSLGVRWRCASGQEGGVGS